MAEKIDTFSFKKRLKKTLENVKALPEPNRSTILNFDKKLVSEGLSIARRDTILQKLVLISKRHKIKDYKNMNKEDAERLQYEVQDGHLGEYAKKTYLEIVRKLLKHLENENHQYIVPRLNKKNLKKVTREELLSYEDAHNIINATTNIRDRAFISLLYESGCRVGEIASCKISSIIDNGDSMTLHVVGKTGERRVPYLLESISIVREWLKSHPRPTPESALWVNKNGEEIGYRGLTKRLETAVNNSGINKKVTTRLFRKSRATYLASKGFSEAQLNAYFGWIPGSTTSGFYVRMNDKDLKDALYELYGKKDREKVKEKVCFNCQETNPGEASYCFKCSLPLNQEKLIEQQQKKEKMLELQRAMMQNPEFIDKLLEIMRAKSSLL